MSYTLNTWKDPYGEGFRTTKAKQVVLEEGLTVLVGCNGAGKTTFLMNLKDQIEKEKLPLVNYDNLDEGGSKSYGELISSGNYNFLSTLVCSSEGESINLQMCRIAGYLHEFIKTGETPKSRKQKSWNNLFKENPDPIEKEPISNKRFVLLDAVDSGFSVDNIVSLKEDLFQLAIEDAKKEGIELYIIISANEYELARGENCLDVMSGKSITFKDYEDYRKFILNSRKRKEKRIETTNKKNNKGE